MAVLGVGAVAASAPTVAVAPETGLIQGPHALQQRGDCADAVCPGITPASGGPGGSIRSTSDVIAK